MTDITAPKTQRFLLRLPPDLADQAKIRSSGRGQSMNGLIVQALAEWLEQEGSGDHRIERFGEQLDAMANAWQNMDGRLKELEQLAQRSGAY